MSSKTVHSSPLFAQANEVKAANRKGVSLTTKDETGANQETSDIAVRVSTLSKCFHIYDHPQDRLKQSLLPRLQRHFGRPPKQYFREFWALRDISFEIKKGETVGIVGRNGSGKSTLLQIICGTLTPTSGEVATHGRIAALLELGSGFNPEFTGRENVYMNATVLGLSKEETDARLDDIVAFADIGEFIDQPVKTYSSGMVMRLAFAVIAHVDADILVVDEALAVGDAVFVQKCMRYLRRFRESGTLLFVSHDIQSVINLCDHAIWLDQGSTQKIGDATLVANDYMEYCAKKSYRGQVELESIVPDKRGEQNKKPHTLDLTDLDGASSLSIFENIENSEGWRTGAAEITSALLLDNKKNQISVLKGGEDVTLLIRVNIHCALRSPIIGFFVKDRLGQSLFGEHTFLYSKTHVNAMSGSVLEASFDFRLPLLPSGDYSMTVSIADGDPKIHIQHHWLHDAIMIKVVSNELRYGLVGILFRNVSLRNI